MSYLGRLGYLFAFLTCGHGSTRSRPPVGPVRTVAKQRLILTPILLNVHEVREDGPVRGRTARIHGDGV